VLIGLWMGRDHLRAVCRKAFAGVAEVDDDDEIASYRASVFGLIASVAVMVGWLWLMGVKWWVAVGFIAVALLIFIGISRVVAEAGLAAVRSPMIAPDLMIHGLGSNLIGAGGVFNLSLAYIWAADIRIFIMALIANGLKLVEDMDLRSRRMVLWGVYLAILIGAAGSCWMVLHITYRHGVSIWSDGFTRAARRRSITTRCSGSNRRGSPGTGWLFSPAAGPSCSP